MRIRHAFLLPLLAVLCGLALIPSAKGEPCTMKDANGREIRAAVYLPENSRPPYKTIILSHGFGGRFEPGIDAYARWFARHGYAAFAFNFRPDSKRDMLDTSVLTETATLNAVIDQVMAREDVDKEYLYLLGESQGGFVSTHTAYGRGDIRALVLLYPAYVLQYDTWARHREVNGGAPFDPVFFDPDALDTGKITSPADTVMGTVISRLYSVDALSFNIYEEMRAIQIPVLIIHGTADRIVPFRYGQDAADPEKGFPRAELIPIPGADHGFIGKDFETAAESALAFLAGQ